MGIQTAYIPLSLAPGLIDVDFGGASLYDVLRGKFQLVASNAREIHSAILIAAPDASILHVPEGSAGIAGKRMTFLADGRPLEFVASVMRGDRYEIVLDLTGTQRPR
jgi:GntR family transcriptional regulator